MAAHGRESQRHGFHGLNRSAAALVREDRWNLRRCPFVLLATRSQCNASGCLSNTTPDLRPFRYEARTPVVSAVMSPWGPPSIRCEIPTSSLCMKQARSRASDFAKVRSDDTCLDLPPKPCLHCQTTGRRSGQCLASSAHKWVSRDSANCSRIAERLSIRFSLARRPFESASDRARRPVIRE